MDLIGDERGRLARVAGWLDVSPAEAVGLVVLLVGSVLATAALVWSALGRPALPDAAEVVPTSVGAEGPAGAVGSAPGEPGPGDDHAHADGREEEAADPGELMVHVAGAVASPGLVTLPTTSRIADAISAAGGMLDDADASRVNLARPLVDGEQIVVLREGEDPHPTAGGDPTLGAGGEDPVRGGPIDLNLATVAQLQTLPGIGPTLAQRIVRHREQLGPFQAPGDLRDVSGIGEKRFQDLADLVTVG